MFRIGKEEIQELTKVIESRDMFKINQGLQESAQVEAKLSKIFNCKHPIFMTSGHAALTSALIGMGIGPGDQVIVPAYTYIATAMAVVNAGAIPVIAEVDETLTIDPADIEKKITPNTKAIIPVHIQGFPCNMDAIMKLADKYGIKVLEDACQADGGAFGGKRLGSIGHAGALSFNFYKIVSSGEGGALLTSDQTIFERALIYQDSSAIAFFGDQMSGFSTQPFCGTEFRSNELCAAVMNMQLDKLDDILHDLRANKKYMMDALKDQYQFAPSNDIAGDCGTTIPFRFESEEKARAFANAESIVAAGIKCTLPIDTGKHVYRHWAPIIEKRGACHPLMDPFKMEANLPITPNYTEDMCPKSLDLLARTVYVHVNPDHTTAEMDARIAAIRAAL
ncbi:MAG: aminotransferase class V-fold PLP-dependent enzyme [Ruminococcaceae bacterium]|nr:aminotransferase class V-fold PLP-dependent enzyme [Oscillospiraceae bacterium]